MDNNNLMQFDLPQNKSSIIKVIGVGGGGGNAVNYMYEKGIKDVDFIVCNTDAQDLAKSFVPVKVQLGESLTGGRGAGSIPEQGKQAAIESIEQINNALGSNTKMVFITAGMGGGTGTGAAPIIAEEAKKKGILTVGIVTMPFLFEGKRRVRQAIEGIERLKEYVDSMIVINNEKLKEIYGDSPVGQAFGHADNILTTAAKSIAEIITVQGVVNVDFEDVHTVMRDSGVALMGSATAEGEGRAIKAIQNAIASPLLNNNDINGAQNMLIHITSSAEGITMAEMGLITDYAQEAAGQKADVIWGFSSDPKLGDKVSVTIIATGFDTDVIPEIYAKKLESSHKEDIDVDKNRNSLEEEVTEYLLDFDKEIEVSKKSDYVSPTDFELSEVSNLLNIRSDTSSKPIRTHWTDQEIEDLEKEPAFLRRKFKESIQRSSDNDNEIDESR